MGHNIFINFDEHQAGIYDTKPGWNLLDCTGDELLKGLYLEQELSDEDRLAWCDGVITGHCREALEGIGGLDANDVKIEFSRDNRRYEIEVTEKVSFVFLNPNIPISANQFASL